MNVASNSIMRKPIVRRWKPSPSTQANPNEKEDPSEESLTHSGRQSEEEGDDDRDVADSWRELDGFASRIQAEVNRGAKTEESSDLAEVAQHGADKKAPEEKSEDIQLLNLQQDLVQLPRWSSREKPESVITATRMMLLKMSEGDVVSFLKAVLTREEIFSLGVKQEIKEEPLDPRVNIKEENRLGDDRMTEEELIALVEQEREPGGPGHDSADDVNVSSILQEANDIEIVAKHKAGSTANETPYSLGSYGRPKKRSKHVSDASVDDSKRTISAADDNDETANKSMKMETLKEKGGPLSQMPNAVQINKSFGNNDDEITRKPTEVDTLKQKIRTRSMTKMTANKANVMEEKEKTPRSNQSCAALIAAAIISLPNKKGTVSMIYHAIMNKYPFCRKNDKALWHNLIRHNLSMHKEFIRETRKYSIGGYWTVASWANLDDLIKKKTHLNKSSPKPGAATAVQAKNEILVKPQALTKENTSSSTAMSSSAVTPLPDNHDEKKVNVLPVIDKSAGRAQHAENSAKFEAEIRPKSDLFLKSITDSAGFKGEPMARRLDCTKGKNCTGREDCAFCNTKDASSSSSVRILSAVPAETMVPVAAVGEAMPALTSEPLATNTLNAPRPEPSAPISKGQAVAPAAVACSSVPGSKPELINLKVVFPNSKQKLYSVKTSAQLGKLKKAASEKLRIPLYRLRFLFDGVRINDFDTPEIMEMEQDDIINVYVAQSVPVLTSRLFFSNV